jgi:hypothetical protein
MVTVRSQKSCEIALKLKLKPRLLKKGNMLSLTHKPDGQCYSYSGEMNSLKIQVQTHWTRAEKVFQA